VSGAQLHGSVPFAELRRLGIAPGEIVDFSATVNPHPLREAVAALVTARDIAAYPDPECHDAVAALAAHHGIDPHWVAMTAGMTEAIYALPHAFPSAAMFAPTYGDYAAAFARSHVPVTCLSFPAAPAALRDTVARLRMARSALLIVCNPNNPDGSYLEREHVAQLCLELPDTVVCIDESYQEQGEGCESAVVLLEEHRNLLLLKSLTKPFGIGGIRIAYALGAGRPLQRLRRFLLPWAVSTIGQRLVPALFAHIDRFRAQWEDTLAQRNRMAAGLRGAGLAVRHGRCPFLLVNVANATEVRARLLTTHRLCVRDCTSFGLPEWIRVMPRSAEQNSMLILRLVDLPRIAPAAMRGRNLRTT